MLRSEQEYQNALTALKRLEKETIPAARAKWESDGLSRENIEENLTQLELQRAELKDEVVLYARIRSGDLSMFREVEQLGDLLIAARIAHGWTQRELAGKLDVHETQVSRDERSRYHGITPERLHRICEVLGLSLHLDAHIDLVAA